jgi:hypothetical protein
MGPRWKELVTLLQHPSSCQPHILWECKETEDQRTNKDMKKEPRKKGMEKIIDYATTVQRNRGMENNRKVSKIRARRIDPLSNVTR